MLKKKISTAAITTKNTIYQELTIALGHQLDHYIKDLPPDFFFLGKWLKSNPDKIQLCKVHILPPHKKENISSPNCLDIRIYIETPITEATIEQCSISSNITTPVDPLLSRLEKHLNERKLTILSPLIDGNIENATWRLLRYINYYIQEHRLLF